MGSFWYHLRHFIQIYWSTNTAHWKTMFKLSPQSIFSIRFCHYLTWPPILIGLCWEAWRLALSGESRLHVFGHMGHWRNDKYRVCWCIENMRKTEFCEDDDIIYLRGSLGSTQNNHTDRLGRVCFIVTGNIKKHFDIQTSKKSGHPTTHKSIPLFEPRNNPRSRLLYCSCGFV